MVKAKGMQEFDMKNIWKYFGLNYPRLEDPDKIGVLSMIPEMFNLDVFEKVLEEDDYDRYDDNPIHFTPFEIGAYHRTFLGKKIVVIDLKVKNTNSQ
jgi:hypothetical protein